MAETIEITLKDGSRVTLRPIAPDDKEELLAAFERLSPTSRYLRFHSFKNTLTRDDLRYLTEVDGKDHFAIVATVPTHDLRKEIGAGVARFVRDPNEKDLAEAAITVADDFQGKGLGKALFAPPGSCGAKRRHPPLSRRSARRKRSNGTPASRRRSPRRQVRRSGPRS
ncbi:MAG: hypothetical protein IPK82_19060 [Polyangiaceae bacterium]|nr:hypothetical protein [Polyangiaceae bacterium]